MTAAISLSLDQRLENVLERYLGRIVVASVLHTARTKLAIPPGPLTAGDLEPLVEEAMIGLRLFCEPERLPDLLFDLALFCDGAPR